MSTFNPLFDGVSNPRMQALIAIALGCDALPGGVPGIGAGTLHKLLSACNWNDPLGVHVELAAKLAIQQKALVTDPEALLCMANSLMYEKTNSVVGYMFDIPKIIEKYNEAFASPETQLVDGPPMLMCKGCDGQEHSFLQAETVSVCLSCQSNLCRFCM